MARLLLLETLCMGVLALLAGKLGYDPMCAAPTTMKRTVRQPHLRQPGCGNHSCH